MDARFSDQACNEEELPPLFDNSGSLQVYRVDDTGKCPISQFEHGNFFTGDCYIVSYKHTEEEKDAYFFYCWIGSFSTQEDQAAAFELVTKDASIQGGKAVQGYIFEGQEPPEFIGLFQKFFLLKGGLSSGYQRRIRDESLTDDAYNEDGVALFHVEGTGPHNNKAVQLSLDVRDLNSCSCYILHAGGTLYVWNGNHSTSVKQEVAMKLAESFKQGSAPESLKEGSEPSEFWDALGGKKFCSSNSQVNQISNDPRLFACSILDGKLEAAEIFNYTQSDLLSEDVMLLDAHTEVFVWVGANADAKEKQQAFQMAQKYVQQRAALEGLPETVSQYILTEGNEPFFFTKHFKKWDKIKTSGQGNSFQKRIALLLGEQFQKPNKNEAMTASSSSKDVERKDSSQPGEYIPYERLKVDSDDPAAGVDPEKRESYLSPDEFMELFGMDSEQFYELPKWKQEKHKKTLNLF
ncbi:hypothetical protein KP509_04G056400 [Ceratopteris richardii]|nr:hypothetical protein KP509_04G056400 [Ceratopteris richardii]